VERGTGVIQVPMGAFVEQQNLLLFSKKELFRGSEIYHSAIIHTIGWTPQPSKTTVL
jgi:hypothetical protein